MASQRQVAANRRNAHRSTGPRSRAGKRRSSGNALRHGLSGRLGDHAGAQVDALAHLLVGDNADEQMLELAYVIVRAHLHLQRVRQVKSDIMERVHQFGALEALPRFRSRTAELKYVMSHLREGAFRWPDPADAVGPMPGTDPERAAEARRRLLPELLKLDGYEARAWAWRNRAMRALMLLKIQETAF